MVVGRGPGDFQWPNAPEPVQCPRLLLIGQGRDALGDAHRQAVAVRRERAAALRLASKPSTHGSYCADGSVLLIEPDRITKRDAAGKTVWTHILGKGLWQQPCDAACEPDGTTTILAHGLVYSVDGRGHHVPHSDRQLPASYLYPHKPSDRPKLAVTGFSLGPPTARPRCCRTASSPARTSPAPPR